MNNNNYKHTYSNHQLIRIFLTAIVIICFNSSCKKFVTVDPPRTDLIRTTVFESDETALAAADNLYGQMMVGGFGGGYTFSYTFLGALSADELINFISYDNEFVQFNECAIQSTNTKLNQLWDEPYKIIYRANALIEGLSASSAVSEVTKKQLRGEALFIRSFCYFYLVNLFGDVPLVLLSEYKVNTSIARTSTQSVYEQIIADLTDAKTLLPSDYSTSISERVRPNKGAAAALLARAYLYTGEWDKAAIESSELIDNTALYHLENTANVFLKETAEAIWQLGKTTSDASEGFLFDMPLSFNCSLTPEFAASFESSDNRFTNWIAVEDFGDVVDYFYPVKYRTSYVGVTKHSIVFRLAEQYLIRAEARARLSDFEGAKDDIDVIRARAGLSNTLATDLNSILDAIETERNHELFTEWGDRWINLRRTGRLDEVVGVLKPNWQSYKSLYPIPASQILNDPAMTNAQNPGYE